MGLRIVCSGHLVRHPLGGHSWHHLQYLIGLQRLGHAVTFFEHHGWPKSCFDPTLNYMTEDPSYGLAYLKRVLQRLGLDFDWCYMSQPGASYGISREELAQRCRECDLYLNLSNVNWIPELEACRRLALVDTDPVFTQIGAHGMRVPFSRYHALFTYGENVHRSGCSMPDGGARWLPTRQPVVVDLWPVEAGDPGAPLTTVINWLAYGAAEHEGRIYRQKDWEFEPFFTFPGEVDEAMEAAVDPPTGVRDRLIAGGWRVVDPLAVTRDPWTYQEYLRASRGEFCVAKHAYVVTGSGWFSDRSAAYLASGRPVVIQETGFSRFLPCGEGLLSFRDPGEAKAAIQRLRDGYEGHCRAARALIEEQFDARRVLTELLERAL